MLDGFNIPRPVQAIVYDVCERHLQLKEPELFLLHKVAYIGGRLEELEFLLNLFEFYTGSMEIMEIP